jgi:hypothetical protein
MQSTKKVFISALMLSLSGVVSVPVGQAAENGAMQSLPAQGTAPKLQLSLPRRTTPLGMQFPRRTASDAEQLTEVGMLTDLRDTRLCLTQLKQQAVNLFQEATRTVITESIEPLETTPDSVNAQMLKEGEKYMQPRKEWLFFYINTLEPIVHLLSEDIQDVDTNGRKSWPEIEQRVNPLWSKWQEDIAEINKAMDQVQEHIEDDSNNLTIAKAAITIFERADHLQTVRYKVALIFREEFRKQKKAAKK